MKIIKKCGNCSNFPQTIRNKNYGVCEMDMRTYADHPPCKDWKGKKYNRTKKKRMNKKLIEEELNLEPFDTMKASEDSLKKDWNEPEEDEAWKDL